MARRMSGHAAFGVVQRLALAEGSWDMRCGDAVVGFLEDLKVPKGKYLLQVCPACSILPCHLSSLDSPSFACQYQCEDHHAIDFSP